MLYKLIKEFPGSHPTGTLATDDSKIFKESEKVIILQRDLNQWPEFWEPIESEEPNQDVLWGEVVSQFHPGNLTAVGIWTIVLERLQPKYTLIRK